MADDKITTRTYTDVYEPVDFRRWQGQRNVSTYRCKLSPKRAGHSSKKFHAGSARLSTKGDLYLPGCSYDMKILHQIIFLEYPLLEE